MKTRLLVVIVGLLSLFRTNGAYSETWSTAEYADLANYPAMPTGFDSFCADFNNLDQAVVVMTENTSPNNLYVAGYNKSAGWGPKVLIGNNRNLVGFVGLPSDISISLNDNGDFIVTYKNATTSFLIYAITGHLSTTSTITLNAEHALDVGATTDAYSISAEINNSGHALVAYLAESAGSYFPFVEPYDASTDTWYAKALVSPDPIGAFPYLTMNNNDRFIVSWHGGTQFTARSGVWGTSPTWDSLPVAATPSTPGTPFAGPVLNDNNFALFTYNNGPDQTLEYVTWTPGGGWTAPVTFSTNPSEAYPVVALNSKDEAAVISGDVSGETVTIYSYTPSGGMVEQTTISSATVPGHMTAINENSIALAIYPSTDSSTYATEQPSGETWTTPTQLSAPTNTQFPKGIGINDNNFGIALWVNVAGADNALMFATIQFPLPVPPPQPVPVFPMKGRQIRNRGLVATEFVNHLEWGVVGGASHYNILRNGTYAGRVEANKQTRFNDRNQRKNVPVAYTVIAINSAGAEVGRFYLTVP